MRQGFIRVFCFCFLFFCFFEKLGNDPGWDLGSGIATVFSLIPVTRDLGVLERRNRRHMH